jgi:DNA modification methylase
MNKLYYGDNLDVLRKFIKDESVDLCYIDPPFNSKRNYNQIYNNIGTEDRAQAQAFMDTWTWDDHAIQSRDDILSNKNNVQTAQSIALITSFEKVLGKGSLYAYLVSMTARIAEIHRTLKPTGSFYLHCDDVADSYLRLICDSLFVSRGGKFQNELVWKRTSAHNDANKFGRNTDRIHYFTKSEEYTFNVQYQPFEEAYTEQYYRYKEPDGRRFMSGDLTGAGGGPPRDFGERGILNPPPGRHWMYDQNGIDKALKENRIFWTKNGIPRLKRFLDESKGMPAQDLWIDIQALRSWHTELLGYPTQKPEALLNRIISASSNEGDTVLDAFCGCGTSIVVAQRLKRRWLGIDITFQSISLILKRLTRMFSEELGGSEKHFNVMDAIELHGVPRDMEAVDALIHKKDDRVRKEFEKWAVLTYSDNRAVINEKKGADKGIDGIAFTRKTKDVVLPVIISVKSGNIGRKEVAELRGTIEREVAACGILITRNAPTKPMLAEAKSAGQFKPEYHNAFDRIQIVTVQQILEGERMSLPLMEEVTKKAQKGKADDQPALI